MLKCRKAIVLILLIPVLSSAEVGQGTGLQLSVAGDIVGTFGSTAQNRLDPREAEILLYAPIDHVFDGLVSLAAHNEQGQVFFELHELTFGSSKLIPRSRFRIGQYFLGIGRLNQFHRHDWPFISAPKVHSDFLNEEGIQDTGIEYAYLLPTSFYLDLTVGITNGWVFGHSHTQGTKPNVPTHYARLATYVDLFSDGGMQTGLNYLGRKDSAGENTTLLGLDLTAKWRQDKILRFLLQSEFWYRVKSPKNAETERTLGFYIYPQYGFSSTFSAGLRIDGYNVLSLKDAGGNKISNFDYGLVPTLAYRASEFSTVKASYGFLGALKEGKDTNPQRVFEIQAVFILGAHPSHDF